MLDPSVTPESIIELASHRADQPLTIERYVDSRRKQEDTSWLTEIELDPHGNELYKPFEQVIESVENGYRMTRMFSSVLDAWLVLGRSIDAKPGTYFQFGFLEKDDKQSVILGLNGPDVVNTRVGQTPYWHSRDQFLEKEERIGMFPIVNIMDIFILMHEISHRNINYHTGERPSALAFVMLARKIEGGAFDALMEQVLNNKLGVEYIQNYEGLSRNVWQILFTEKLLTDFLEIETETNLFALNWIVNSFSTIKVNQEIIRVVAEKLHDTIIDLIAARDFKLRPYIGYNNTTVFMYRKAALMLERGLMPMVATAKAYGGDVFVNNPSSRSFADLKKYFEGRRNRRHIC